MANPEGKVEPVPFDYRKTALEWMDHIQRENLRKEDERHDRLSAAIRSVGRPRVNYGRPEIDNMTRLIMAGHGRISACAELGIGYRSFHRYLKEHPAVAIEVRLAEKLRLDRCLEQVYQRAVGLGEQAVRLRAAMYFLNRRDRIDAARAARRERADRARTPDEVTARPGGPDGSA